MTKHRANDELMREEITQSHHVHRRQRRVAVAGGKHRRDVETGPADAAAAGYDNDVVLNDMHM